MFSEDTLTFARRVLSQARERKVEIVTAESCTGGLVAAALTTIPGSSDAIKCGFVTYSNHAKTELLGVPEKLIQEHGAVSRATARAMAKGACKRIQGRIAVAVTGLAGPGGDGTDKPVGLVHIAVAYDDITFDEECRFGDIGRDAVRMRSVDAALTLLLRMFGP